jgi:hypothetical protein
LDFDARSGGPLVQNRGSGRQSLALYAAPSDALYGGLTVGSAKRSVAHERRYERLPRLWDHEGALLRLHERTNELLQQVDAVEFAQRLGARQLEKDLAALKGRIDEELGQVRAERQAEAVSDSRWQFGGFVLVLVGLGFQLLGAISQVLAT